MSIDNIPLENLDFSPTDEVLGGIVETVVYGAEISQMATVAGVPSLSDATSLADAATISEAHEFEAGAGFHKIKVLVDTGVVESSQIGTKQQLGVQNSFTFAIPSDAQGRGYFRKYKNRAMIFLVRERSGRLVQLGSKNNAARLEELTGTSGTAAGDANNLSLVIRDAQPYLPPIYEGTIQEFPAP